MSTVASVGPSGFGDLLLEAEIFALGVSMFQRAIYEVRDLVGIERFGDVVVSAIFEGGDGGFDGGITGHHDADDIGLDLVDAALQFDSIGAAHFDIEERYVPFAFGEAQEGFAGVFGGANFESFLAKPFAERVAHAQFVIDDQKLSFDVTHVHNSWRCSAPHLCQMTRGTSLADQCVSGSGYRHGLADPCIDG
jgi:hypothetical protein